MKTTKLLSPYKLGNIWLKNHVVMAPLTRSRAIGNIPNDLMALYYGQRADAGLIIAEGTSPSPNGLGYPRIPGIFSKEQIKGWQKITSVVHEKGSKIFLQIMHTGRINHQSNLPEGAIILAPSAVKAEGKIRIGTGELMDFPVPKEMSLEEVEIAKNEFIQAGINAIEAGFDGVELHNANGYLLEQFLSPITNTRNDNYGGSIENRCRFVLEVVDGLAASIGKEKTGIRLSPYGIAGDMHHYDQIDDTYVYLTKELSKREIVYLHFHNVAALGVKGVPARTEQLLRANFKNTFMVCGGLNKNKAEEILKSNTADLTAFGKPFINNPDLVFRFENDIPLADNLDVNTFYTADEKGYSDYPLARNVTS